MIVTYDTTAKAMYFQLRPDVKVARTVRKDSVLLDLDDKGELIGVEIIRPTNMKLRVIARKYHQPELSRVNSEKLQEALAAQ